MSWDERQLIKLVEMPIPERIIFCLSIMIVLLALIIWRVW